MSATATKPRTARLNAKYMPIIQDYVAQRAAKSAAGKTAEAANKKSKELFDALYYGAMGEAETAVCGNVSLTLKVGSGADATLTLKDETKISWDDVREVVLKNGDVVKVRQIEAIYGGKGESMSLTVVGV